MTDILDSFLTKLSDRALQNLATGLLNALSGSAGAPGSIASLLFGSVPQRAAGSPVSAGRPYLVGEAGRELFVPRSPGTVIPNNRLTSAGAQKVTVNVS